MFSDGPVTKVIMDSVSCATCDNHGDIIISGSHGGASSARYAMDAAAADVVFNDTGCGKNSTGIRGPELLQQHSIISAAADYRRAEIANGADACGSGVISHVNGCDARAGSHGSPATPQVQATGNAHCAHKEGGS